MTSTLPHARAYQGLTFLTGKNATSTDNSSATHLIQQTKMRIGTPCGRRNHTIFDIRTRRFPDTSAPVLLDWHKIADLGHENRRRIAQPAYPDRDDSSFLRFRPFKPQPLTETKRPFGSADQAKPSAPSLNSFPTISTARRLIKAIRLLPRLTKTERK